MLKSGHVITNRKNYSDSEFDASLNSITEEYSPPSALSSTGNKKRKMEILELFPQARSYADRI